VQPDALAEDQAIVAEPEPTTALAVSVRVGAAGGAGTLTVKLTLLAADAPMTLAQLSE
jgi:hypothetical protein